MTDEHSGHEAPREDGSGRPDDALDGLLKEDTNLHLYDLLRRKGHSVDEAVQRLVYDKMLKEEDAPRFAREHRNRTVLPGKSGKPRKPAGKANGKGTEGSSKDTAGGISLSDEEASRLTSHIVDVALGSGLEPGKNIEIRPDGSWFCRSPAGYGDGAFELLVRLHGGDEAVALAEANKWLAEHSDFGPFIPVDDTDDNRAADQGRQIEIEDIWTKRGKPVAGTIFIDFLSRHGFDKKALAAISGDMDGLRLVYRWSGGNPAIMAPVKTAGGTLVALHLQSLELGTADVTRRGKALGEPRNKRGRASWLDDGTIQLGKHGADAPPTMHMALTLSEGLALRAAGVERLAVPPLPRYLGRAAIPPDVRKVVVVGVRSESTQRGLVRLLCQPDVDLHFAELSAGEEGSQVTAKGILAKQGAAALTAAAAVDAPLWRRGDNAFMDEIFRIDNVTYLLMRSKLKKISGLPPVGDITSARTKARKQAAAVAEAEAEAAALEAALAAADATGEAGGNRKGPRHAVPHQDQQVLADILDDLLKIADRYLDLPPGARTLIALYAAYTNIYRKFRRSPRLFFYSKEPNTGKSTAARLTLGASQDHKRYDETSASAMFRYVDRNGGTLCLDEFEATTEMGIAVEKLIRIGYERGGIIGRSTPTCAGDYESDEFDVFGPVIVCSNFLMRDTTLSRCIFVEMSPATGFLPEMGDTADEELAVIARRLARWAVDAEADVDAAIAEIEQVTLADDGVSPEPPDRIIPRKLRSRTRNKWLPLYVVAHLAGDEWRKRVREAQEALAPVVTRDTLGLGIQLLLSCRDILASNPKKDDWPANVIQAALHALPNTPWLELPKTGKPITTAMLGRMLRDYGVHVVRDAKLKTWSYQRKFFELVFAKYLTPDRVSETAAPPDVPAEAGAAGENTGANSAAGNIFDAGNIFGGEVPGPETVTQALEDEVPDED